jgi:hypothetical protein
MGITHIPDGKDFDHTSFSKDFGFHGSTVDTARPHISKPQHEPKRQSPSDLSAKNVAAGDNTYSHGGNVHPHGHHVVDVEHMHDGSIVHHHAHGGYSCHHAGGEITHHDGNGSHLGMETSKVAYAHGGSTHVHPHGHHITHMTHHGDMEVQHHAHGGYTIHHGDGVITHHDAAGEPASHGLPQHYRNTSDYEHEEHMAHGGHAGHTEELPNVSDYHAQKKLGKKMMHEVEDSDHGGGEMFREHKARGGMPMQGRMAAPMHGVARAHAPRKPINVTSPRNVMPGGRMGYGVEPTSEEPPSDMGDMDNDGMKHGGRAKHHKR